MPCELHTPNILLCRRESLLHLAPINDIPDGIHIVRTDVPIIDVIGMFPNVDPEERHEAGSCLQRVLIRACSRLDASWYESCISV